TLDASSQMRSFHGIRLPSQASKCIGQDILSPRPKVRTTHWARPHTNGSPPLLPATCP
ncbi:hypothetical protein B0H10DRAFT_2088531, partial [Mycena sp. CBHHK59/15]